MAIEAGEQVRLATAANGMPADSEGILLGRYVNTGEALVNFWDGGPIRVPEGLLEPGQPTLGCL